MSQPPASSWFVDIRKAALIACVGTVLGLLIPTWNLTHSMLATASARGQEWWIPIVVLMSLFSLIMPAFYFAAYRNKGSLQLSNLVRLWSLTAAIVWGTLVAMGLPKVIESFSSRGDESVLSATRVHWTTGDVSILLGQLSNFTCILLLIALYRHASDEAEPADPVSRLLRIMTRVAVIGGGLCVALYLVRLLEIPYFYLHLRDYGMQNRRIPRLQDALAREIRNVLMQACAFAAPFIVWRGIPRAAKTALPEIGPVDGTQGVPLS